jgi:RNA polymerase sigma factor (sigma-70 family)
MTTMPATLSSLLEADFMAARRGDQNAFRRLVLATQRMVASIALAVTRDVQLSEDIAQETYLKAWHKLAAMNHPDSFLPWLRQVTRNQAIDHVRRRRHQELSLDETDIRLAHAPDGGPGPDASLQSAERAELLARALDEIPDESREVLLLFYREGQSSRQVAQLLGLSDGAVRKRLQRARDVLQAGLLAQVGEVARHSAPGLAFTAIVAASLASGPAQAGAATAATATAGTWLLAGIGSVVAALAVVLGAVFWEVRYYVTRARNPAERRELRRHGVLDAALMASFVGVLWWSNRQQWTFSATLAVSAIYSLAIIGLGVRRHLIHRRHRRDT